MARSGSRRIYTVDDKIYKTNWHLFGGSWRCQLCGEAFRKGDRILAVYNKKIKWYHKKCYDLTLYDG